MNIFEKSTKKYFDSIGLTIEKIKESKNKTPDFEGGEILVEVKAIHPQELEGVHKDLTYNTIKNNLQDAARKFRDYDPDDKKDHTVVIFSENIISEDIYSVWTGEFSPNVPHRIFSSGMLLSKKHKEYIDAVIWFENHTTNKPRYVWGKKKSIKSYFPNL